MGVHHHHHHFFRQDFQLSITNHLSSSYHGIIIIFRITTNMVMFFASQVAIHGDSSSIHEDAHHPTCPGRIIISPWGATPRNDWAGFAMVCGDMVWLSSSIMGWFTNNDEKVCVWRWWISCGQPWDGQHLGLLVIYCKSSGVNPSGNGYHLYRTRRWRKFQR